MGAELAAAAAGWGGPGSGGKLISEVKQEPYRAEGPKLGRTMNLSRVRELEGLRNLDA